MVGSQFLYGPEVLDTVAKRAAEMAEKLNRGGKLPCKVVFKTIVKTSEEATEAVKAANHFTFDGFLAKVNYENPPTDEQIVAKCPAKCMAVDPHWEAGV